MFRKPLPSEIEEQKDVYKIGHGIELVQPEYPFPLNPYHKELNIRNVEKEFSKSGRLPIIYKQIKK